MIDPSIKMLVLSLTGRCNFACRYCYAAEHDKNKMSLETAIRAVNLAAASGERFVLQFSGGEPLMNYSVLKGVVEYVKDNNIPAQLQIQTNGSKLTDEIAKFLYQNKVGIGVSLDGRPKVNDKLRLKKNGYGATGEILKGLEVLKRNNIACGITCVVTSENVDELEGIVDFAYFIGNIRRIGFDLLRGQGRGTDLEPPTEEAMSAAMERVFARSAALKPMAGFEIAITQKERVQSLCKSCTDCFGHCYAMNGEAAFVDAKGDIYACSSLVGMSEYYIGNVLTGIEASLVETIRQKIKAFMSVCLSCKNFKHCGGGCYARWCGTVEKNYPAECALMRACIEQAQVEK